MNGKKAKAKRREFEKFAAENNIKDQYFKSDKSGRELIEDNHIMLVYGSQTLLNPYKNAHRAVKRGQI